jgi:hypothetical protein
MFINETLARGLTNRFFQDFDKDIAQPFAKELKSKPLRNIKRGKWIKAARVQVKRLERFLIASYEGGSKVKPTSERRPSRFNCYTCRSGPPFGSGSTG